MNRIYIGQDLEKLIKFAGRPFEKAFLLSAGTEATEAGLKLMRMQGQKQKKRRLGRRLFPLRDLFLQASACEALVKSIYTTTSIQDFLLPSKEGMALTADIQQNVLTDGRACLDFVATATASSDFLITRMNVGFH